MTEQLKPCPQCEGSGKMDWECPTCSIISDGFECDVCGGTGNTRSEGNQ